MLERAGEILFSKEEIFPPEKRDASFSIHMKYMKRSPS
jgi:hypothetical protein